MARLKTRLDRLAQGRPESGLSRKECELLVSVLAKRDSLFWPWRFQKGGCAPLPEIRRRQREYLNGTIGVVVRGDGRNEWKHAHEMRQTLIAGGYLSAVHVSGQVSSVFLTVTGEAYARALVGSRLRTFRECLIVLVCLQRLSKETSCRAVRESVLFGREMVGCPNDWDDCTELILPFLVTGHVFADTDTEGRACYVPKDDVLFPAEVEVDAKPDDGFDRLYVKAFGDERQVLENTEPRDPHEIIIPLPATGWGWPCHFEEANHEKK